QSFSYTLTKRPTTLNKSKKYTGPEPSVLGHIHDSQPSHRMSRKASKGRKRISLSFPRRRRFHHPPPATGGQSAPAAPRPTPRSPPPSPHFGKEADEPRSFRGPRPLPPDPPARRSRDDERPNGPIPPRHCPDRRGRLPGPPLRKRSRATGAIVP